MATGQVAHTFNVGQTVESRRALAPENTLAAFDTLKQPVTKSIKSVVVVHLSTGDITVTTFIDDTFTVESS